MIKPGQTPEVSIALLDAELETQKTSEATCRSENREEHTQIFDRLRETEKQLALVGQRVAMWAAVGAVAGSAVVSTILYAVQHHLIP